MLTPYSHQVEGAAQAYEVLRKYGLVYLAYTERVGKSLTALMTFEKTSRSRCLVLTKKKALGGWEETLSGWGYTRNGDWWIKGPKAIWLTNHHQASKLEKIYDMAILDESHAVLASLPKAGKIWKDIYKIVYGLPLIYLSGTPFAEHVGQIYPQLRLSAWSPFKEYANFYSFFRIYGRCNQVRTPYGFQETYSKYHDDAVLKKIDHLFLKLTREDVGFDHEPEDRLHRIPLRTATRELIIQTAKTEMLHIGEKKIPLDSPMKLRTTVYQLEGGWVLHEGACLPVGTVPEKVDYILREWGDSEDLVIMAHFRCEQEHLKKWFKKAEILSATAMAEGVDLSHRKHLVIYSMDFSAARYSQRRARQANKNRKEPIIVHYLLAEGGVGEAVYETVAVKHGNFIKNSFERWRNQLKENK